MFQNPQQNLYVTLCLIIEEMRLLTILLMIIAINVQGNNNDTLICKQKVLDFYDWYRKAINQEINEVFLPRFVEDNKGYTTLDFSEYEKNLKRFGFTDKLITKEFKTYQTCIQNLEKIEYKKFKEFDDLSNYEDINCDFFNIHRWINSMESFSGIEIIKSKIKSRTCKIYGKIYEEYDSNQKQYYGNIIVTLIEENGKWMIDDIEI